MRRECFGGVYLPSRQHLQYIRHSLFDIPVYRQLRQNWQQNGLWYIYIEFLSCVTWFCWIENVEVDNDSIRTVIFSKIMWLIVRAQYYSIFIQATRWASPTAVEFPVFKATNHDVVFEYDRLKCVSRTQNYISNVQSVVKWSSG